MKIVGHRGAAGLAPENTLASLKVALELGVDAVEFDVRLTKDRQLVLMHDDDLERTCGQKTKIRDLSLKQLLRIPTLSGEPIPTLVQALELIGNSKTIFLEPKDSDMFNELIKITKDYTADIRYTTREHGLLAKIKEFNPKLKIYPTNDWVWKSLTKQVKNLNADGLSINYTLLNPLSFWQIRKNNFDMIIFTVDDPNQIEKANRIFKDAWLCTNRPDIALNILNKS